jgi:hypothetical protein
MRSGTVLRCVRGVHFHHKSVPFPHRIAILDPPCSATVRRCVVGAHFHYECVPFPHRIAILDRPRSVAVLRCVRGAHYQLSLAAPGCPWLLLGCSWAAPGLLLGCSWAAPGLLLAAPGCSWLPLAASGCSWLLLAGPGCSWLPLSAPGCFWLLLMPTVDPMKTICLKFYIGIIPETSECRRIELEPRRGAPGGEGPAAGGRAEVR